MDGEKSCFFIGHHDARESIYPLLEEAVQRHITQYSVTDFFVGYHGCFDILAAQAIGEAKRHHPDVRLFLVLPYHPAIRPVEPPGGFDGTYYPWEGERVPPRFAIVKTNRRMVQRCEYLIGYAWHFFGGAGQIVEYARRREEKGLLHVENLGSYERTDAP